MEFKHTHPDDDLGLPKGWFDADDISIYQKLVESIPNSGILVEVGVWQGRSLCSVADLIKEKNLDVYAVDTFKGSESALDIAHDCDGRLREVFENNLKEFQIANYITVIPNNSVSAAKEFTKQADLVFIDADHTPEHVQADIRAWLPKVKTEGILAGHDYQWVKDMVHEELESLGYNIETDKKNFWWVNK